MSAQWSVVSLFENVTAREQAMQFCDTLVSRFWPDFSFDFLWCPWTDLARPTKAKEAEAKVREADLILVAMAPGGRCPAWLRHWLELALADRSEREGALVAIPAPDSGLSAEAAAAQAYLRKLAHQSGLDYLTAVPQSLPAGVPESLESYNVRASQMTSVLDTILRHSPTPPRML